MSSSHNGIFFLLDGVFGSSSWGKSNLDGCGVIVDRKRANRGKARKKGKVESVILGCATGAGGGPNRKRGKDGGTDEWRGKHGRESRKDER